MNLQNCQNRSKLTFDIFPFFKIFRAKNISVARIILTENYFRGEYSCTCRLEPKNVRRHIRRRNINPTTRILIIRRRELFIYPAVGAKEVRNNDGATSVQGQRSGAQRCLIYVTGTDYPVPLAVAQGLSWTLSNPHVLLSRVLTVIMHDARVRAYGMSLRRHAGPVQQRRPAWCGACGTWCMRYMCMWYMVHAVHGACACGSSMPSRQAL